MELVIASKNSSKIPELKCILKELFPSLYVRSLFDFPDVILSPDRNDSFIDNAVEKARSVARQSNLPCIADELGLVVPYLGGEQESLLRKAAHPVDKKLPDIQKLLDDLQNASDDLEREAFLVCVLALVVPNGAVQHVRVTMEGAIAVQEKGPATYDFSSVFIKHGYNKSLAQLPQSAFSRISIRRKACEKAWPILRDVL